MLSNLKISKKLRRKINSELQPGESIRWVEQPIPRFFTTASTTYFLFGIFWLTCIFFGVPWTNFAPFWRWGPSGFESSKLREGLEPHDLLPLASIPFVLAGFVTLLNPLWVWQKARSRVYLVTDKRAIVIQGGWSTTISSYLPDQLQDMSRRERANGTGDVIFGIRKWQDRDGDINTEELGFLAIRNPREVEHILRQLVQDNA
jgi:hypothetical protein